MFWALKVYPFLSLKTLRAIVRLFFSNHFSFSDEQFFPSQLYFSIKGLISYIPSGFFPAYSWSNVIVTVHWKHDFFHWLGWFLLFLLLSNQEILYMIYLNLDLFYDICNRINEHNQRQTHYLPLTFPVQFDI